MLLETKINEKDLPRLLKNLNFKLKIKLIRESIDELMKKFIEQNFGYYMLRDETIPELLGEEESKTFFWCLYKGFLYKNGEILNKYLDDDVKYYIKKVVLMYAKDFMLAKKFNSNPIGYYGINYTYQSGQEYNNLFITRNDRTDFLMKMNVTDLLKMTEELLTYYNLIIKDNKEDVIINDESIESIKNIKKYIDYIEKIGEK